MADRRFTDRGKAFVTKHYGKLFNFLTPTRAAGGEQAAAAEARAVQALESDQDFHPTLPQGDIAKTGIELDNLNRRQIGNQHLGRYHSQSRDTGFCGSRFLETGLPEAEYLFVEYRDIESDDMPKSNPFNYENRNNGGAPLGAIIGENFKKQLEKQAKSARKMSGASAISANDPSDKSIEHAVLLIVPRKKLTDDGVAAMVAGMEEALKSSTRGASLVLEEIDLRHNGLTTASLAMLAPVVELSRLHLKSLVLSGNAIKVSTDEEARQFETFLHAFKGCMMLRHVDLSGNAELGKRAFEVLARVHSREPPIDPIPAHGERPVFSASEESLDKAVAPDDIGHKVGVTGGHDTMFDAGFLQRRCGLRSLPYLEVYNVGLDDAGALWLSFVLQDHYMPNQLVNKHNAVSADTSQPTYSQKYGVNGINWTSNNETLGKDGLRLLTQTEKVRERTCLDDTAAPDGFTNTTGALKPVARRPSSAGAASSKASMYTLRSRDEDEDNDVVELESMRKKIQRQIIDHDGVNGAELFMVAVAVVLTSRKLAYMAPTTRKLLRRPVLVISDTSAEATPQAKTQRLDSLTGAAEEDTMESQHSYTLETPHSSLSRNKGRSYAATLAAINVPEAGEASLAITEVTNTPVTPKRTFKAHRKGGFSEGSDMDLVTEKLANAGVTIERDDRPERFIEYQQKYYSSPEHRDTTAACHLPLRLFEKIMAFMVGKDALGALNEEQKRAAYDWGQNKATLATEYGWLRHQESAQKWMLLDAVGCLSYAA